MANPPNRHMGSTIPYATLVELLEVRAHTHADQRIYTFLLDGEQDEASLTNNELARRARAIAAQLQTLAQPGDRALLLYPPGLEYIAAFFGCLYADIIAVPAYPPNPARLHRTLGRIQAIARNAQPTIALTRAATLPMSEALSAQDPAFQAMHWVATDVLPDALAGAWEPPTITPDTLSFLQYTSGSTSTPKGVMLTHSNLMHNLALIHRCFDHSPVSQGVIWLPPYHDMGLIGGILQPLYGGFPVTLMSPVDFLQRPFRWLEAVSRYKATTSGGPNFAYDLCARKITPEQREQLDLSSWKVAFNGAEPIRPETLDRFVEAFGPCGFRREAFYPCYGLAEATLIVSGGNVGQAPIINTFQAEPLEQHRAIEAAEPTNDVRSLVSSGVAQPENQIRIVRLDSSVACAADEVGEIWVAGPSVAQGYWKRAQESEHAFHGYTADNQAGPFLRTGDIGFLHAGQLYVTGRLKDLLIIRGRNYYPQDIELTVEQSHHALRPGSGAAFAVEIEGEERLVIVQEIERHYRKQNLEPVIAAIRQAVAEQHELHAHAIVLISPGSIAKTSSGKIQRHACRSAFLANELAIIGQEVAEIATSDVEPLTLSRDELVAAASAERRTLLASFLQQCIGGMLRVAPSRVAAAPSLIALGLDSLMAVELQHTIETSLHMVVPMSKLIADLRLDELVDLMLDEIGEAPQAATEAWIIAPEPPQEYALSYGQRALWLIHQLAPTSAAYHIISALRISSPLNVPALQRAFQRLVDRHPALRTNILLADGQPVQRVRPEAEAWFHVQDADAWSDDQLTQQMLTLAQRPFDLEHDSLLRVQLFSRSTGEQHLLLAIHHIVADFWSLAVLAHELAQFYGAEVTGIPAQLPVLQADYSSYVAWQQRWLAGAEGERLWRYWQQQLRGISSESSPRPLPVLNLPTDRPRPAIQRYTGATVTTALDASLVQQIRALAHTASTTVYTLLLTAFNVLLYRYTGQNDLLVGTITAGRSRAALAPIFGYFVNPIVVRTQPDGQSTFHELLEQVRQIVQEAFTHQDYPFAVMVERLQPLRDPSRTPLFQVMFLFQQAPHHSPAGLAALAVGDPAVALTLEGLRLEPLALAPQTAQFDLTLMAAESDGRLVLSWNYNTDLFDAATIERWAEQFHTLLAEIVAQPHRAIATIPLLSTAETHYLQHALNATQVDPAPDLCLHEMFEAQAARTPDAIAIGFQGELLTYGELDRRANQLAHYLQQHISGTESLVGLCVDRSPALIVGLLGILKAGCAYIPLDPAYPEERIAFILEHAGVTTLVTTSADAPRRAQGAAAWQIIDLQADWPAITQEPDERPHSDVQPLNLAYVIYTSGSTGKPKGVQIPHGAVVNFLRSMAVQPGITADDVVLLVTTLAFDIAALEIFLPLTTGARLQIAARTDLLDGKLLAAILERDTITLMQATPSTWRLLLESGWRGNRRLKMLCGGEAFPRDLAEQLLSRGGSLWNMYGPTETTIWSAVGAVATQPGPIIIGPPIANTQLYVLDAALQLAPIGVAGELYIGGDGLARGYGQRPDLTAERFIADPFSGILGARLYRTGDLVKRHADGGIEFLGRIDFQVKVRGFRIELGEIESVLRRHPEIQDAVVLARDDARLAGDKQLVAYVVPEQGTKNQGDGLDGSRWRAFLKEQLPEYMIPSTITVLPQLPLTPNGKVDRSALLQLETTAAPTPATYTPPRSKLERAIAAIWQSVLQIEQVSIDDNFFDLGGHSLLLAQVHSRLRDLTTQELSIVELFQYPTISALATHLSRDGAATSVAHAGVSRARQRRALGDRHNQDIAIVGMAGRFPGANDLEAYWENLRAGVESIAHFTDEELLAAGVAPETLRLPNYVRARGTLSDVESFDAAFFGFTPREAEILDPQHRIFLECAWHALEHAGYDSERYQGRIGVFAGSGINSYLLEADRSLMTAAGRYQAFISNDKDFVPTRVSYKLNLRGPSITVQSACSTSLVAVHLACQSLRAGESDMALAGGIAINVPHQAGYLYEDGGILSPDGHCRAFDAQAHGTVSGSGVGIVLLKPFDDALADGDTIHAVIKGSAVNNDGAQKIGYTAPSVDGQAEIIAEALAVAGVEPDSIGYIEAHGTGTGLGDPIEIAALTQAFRVSTDRQGFCALGSVKTNIGHLDTAAGIAGLLKTVLALKHRQIPPSLHFEQPNPKIDFAASPFYVAAQLQKWQANGTPHRAGVSSLGIGGTNAHVILEAAPAAQPGQTLRAWQVLPLAAKTPAALDAMTANLSIALQQQPDLALSDVAYTLQVGRRVFNHRKIVVGQDALAVAAALDASDPLRTASAVTTEARRVGWLFPGQGSQYVSMARGLYEHEPVFREWVDRCCALLEPHLAHSRSGSQDLRTLLYGDQADSTLLEQTQYAQPALFVIEYALAQLWHSWGIEPHAMIGHSIGEYVAATLAGVFRLADALKIVALRGRLIQSLPTGAMLSVALPEQDLLPLLGPDLSLAAVNSPKLCVVSGPEEAIAAFERQLTTQGTQTRRLHTSHAFHSTMMEPIVQPFAEQLRQLHLQPPTLPYISNVSGTWITSAEATDPEYWAQHIRQPVRYADGIRQLTATTELVLLELGPGRALSTLARQVAPQIQAIASMRHPNDPQPDCAMTQLALGKLWLAGVTIDWARVHADEQRRRVPVPLYPFERKRYWIAARPTVEIAPAPIPAADRAALNDWFYAPLWKQSLPPRLQLPASAESATSRWLVFADQQGVAGQLELLLRERGYRVTLVTPGDHFAAHDSGHYQIAPAQPADYVRLIEELRGTDTPPTVIVHTWNITGSQREKALSERVSQAQTHAFESLLLLAQALAKQPTLGAVTLGILSDSMQRVVGETSYPEKSLLLGLCKVIPQELPMVACRSIDLVLESDGTLCDGTPELLLAELLGGAGDAIVAYRGTQRWIQIFEPAHFEQHAAPLRQLRQRGVYLITGGLGGIGLTLAAHLAQTVQARLVLISRRGLPDRALWPQMIETSSDEIRQTIQQLQALEAHGAEVLVLSADVAEPEQMRHVIEQTYEHFGALHGVIHAAGVAGGGMIQMKTTQDAARVLTPKVQGTLAIYEAIRQRPLDFLVLCSSITGIVGGFGQADYCSANIFLDAFAASHNPYKAPFVVSIDWDRWTTIGMAVNSTAPAEFLALQQGAAQPPIRHPLLDRCLLSTPDQAIYWSEFSVAKHWVLAEHLIVGKPTVPGTTYLEMARAAFAHTTNQTAAELDNVVFVAPLTTQEAETKDVLTILETQADSYTFRVLSKSRTRGSTPARWQEHAHGNVRSLTLEPAPPVSIDALTSQSQPVTVPFVDADQQFLITGLRWDTIKQVYADDDSGVAVLELPAACADDLRAYTLHPAMLDTATGAAKFMGEGDYLPLTYGKLRVFGAFSQRIYSSIAYKQAQQASKDIIRCDITILNAQGVALASIEGFSMRRITDDLLAQLQDQTGNAQMPQVLVDEEISRAYDALVEQHSHNADRGITPAEGVRVFDTVLNHAGIAQVIISTSDLRQEIVRVNSLTTSQILDQLVQARTATRPSGKPTPDLANASLGEIEQQVIEIWRRVLGVEQIGINDNFFELGGTSLSGIQVIAELKAALNIEIPAVSIFEAPTVGTLARYLRPEQQAHSFEHSRDRAKKREQGLNLFKGKK